ncbi:hypothetical protein CLOM_g2740 [Closterium sp. NIES-68]|nr:hypothetical protein CLOM_g2740 [Closterium sp. NIES-68]GJP67922.1 hypothetical protein CLOP_g24681 [Closterium sp. NIES-67]GJP70709.1 hypothetical protein CLOP_g1620 [Closterium sp. NIES-67]
MAVAEFPSHHMESTLIGRIPHGDDTLHGQAGFPSLRFSQDWQQRHQEHQKKAHDMWRELQQKRPARYFWHGVAKKQCYRSSGVQNSLPPHLMAYCPAAADTAVTAGAATVPTTAVMAALIVGSGDGSSVGDIQSTSPHGGAVSPAHDTGCATWQPEPAIQGLQHAAVFPCSFGPEAGVGETSSRSTHTPFPHVSVLHGCAVFPLSFTHPTLGCRTPSFAGLLNSTSPTLQHHRWVFSAPATSAVWSPYNCSVPPCPPCQIREVNG